MATITTNTITIGTEALNTKKNLKITSTNGNVFVPYYITEYSGKLTPEYSIKELINENSLWVEFNEDFFKGMIRFAQNGTNDLLLFNIECPNSPSSKDKSDYVFTPSAKKISIYPGEEFILDIVSTKNGQPIEFDIDQLPTGSSTDSTSFMNDPEIEDLGNGIYRIHVIFKNVANTVNGQLWLKQKESGTYLYIYCEDKNPYMIGFIYDVDNFDFNDPSTYYTIKTSDEQIYIGGVKNNSRLKQGIISYKYTSDDTTLAVDFVCGKLELNNFTQNVPVEYDPEDYNVSIKITSDYNSKNLYCIGLIDLTIGGLSDETDELFKNQWVDYRIFQKINDDEEDISKSIKDLYNRTSYNDLSIHNYQRWKFSDSLYTIDGDDLYYFPVDANYFATKIINLDLVDSFSYLENNKLREVNYESNLTLIPDSDTILNSQLPVLNDLFSYTFKTINDKLCLQIKKSGEFPGIHKTAGNNTIIEDIPIYCNNKSVIIKLTLRCYRYYQDIIQDSTKTFINFYNSNNLIKTDNSTPNYIKLQFNKDNLNYMDVSELSGISNYNISNSLLSINESICADFNLNAFNNDLELPTQNNILGKIYEAIEQINTNYLYDNSITNYSLPIYDKINKLGNCKVIYFEIGANDSFISLTNSYGEESYTKWNKYSYLGESNTFYACRHNIYSHKYEFIVIDSNPQIPLNLLSLNKNLSTDITKLFYFAADSGKKPYYISYDISEDTSINSFGFLVNLPAGDYEIYAVPYPSESVTELLICEITLNNEETHISIPELDEEKPLDSYKDYAFPYLEFRGPEDTYSFWNYRELFTRESNNFDYYNKYLGLDVSTTLLSKYGGWQTIFLALRNITYDILFDGQSFNFPIYNLTNISFLITETKGSTPIVYDYSPISEYINLIDAGNIAQYESGGVINYLKDLDIDPYEFKLLLYGSHSIVGEFVLDASSFDTYWNSDNSESINTIWYSYFENSWIHDSNGNEITFYDSVISNTSSSYSGELNWINIIKGSITYLKLWRKEYLEKFNCATYTKFYDGMFYEFISRENSKGTSYTLKNDPIELDECKVILSCIFKSGAAPIELPAGKTIRYYSDPDYDIYEYGSYIFSCDSTFSCKSGEKIKYLAGGKSKTGVSYKNESDESIYITLFMGKHYSII